MKKFKTVYTTFFLLFTASMFFNFSSNPPNGRTGAPGEGTCTGCHLNNAGFAGDISISGFPATIQPNTNYPLTLTVTATMGNPVNAGFQLVALDGNDSNIGTLIPLGPTAIQASGGRTYIEHRPAQAMSGNTVSYNFEWNSPASAGGNEVTLYSVALMGNGGGTNNDLTLTNSLTSTFSGGTPPTVSITNFTDVLCNGGSDGSAMAQGVGGTPPLTYSWSNGGSGTSVSGLSAGIITVTVTDDNGMTGTDQVTISEPSVLSVSITNQTDIDCINATGTATATASGGVGGFSYGWGNGETGTTAVGLPAGVTNVTLTDGNNCSAITFVDILEDVVAPIANVATPNSITCINSSVTLDGTGSSTGANYFYSWTTTAGNIVSGAMTLTPVVDVAAIYELTVTDNNNGCSSTSTVQVIEIADPIAGVTNIVPTSCFDGNDGMATATAMMGQSPFTYAWSSGETTMTAVTLSAGNNSLTVTDNNNCTSVASFMIVSPSEIVVNASATGITANGASDGTASVTSTGGTPPYAYTWSNGERTDMISGLVPGNYTVTTTDSNNCMATASVTVTGFNCSLTGDFSATAVSCFGLNDGSATATPMAGTSPFSYSWSNGENTATITNLAAGTYDCTITDSANCVATGSVTVSEPTELIVNFVKTDVTCFGGNDGSIDLSPTGGTPPYSYSWTGGNNPSASGLTAGDYSPTITDANGCFVTSTITINQPSDIVINLNITNETGNMTNDGSISATVSGGTLAYSYAWSNGATTPMISNLAPGDYILTVTDANGCEKSVTGTVQIFGCAGITTNVDETNTYICPGSSSGSLTIVDFVGGTAPYNFMWSNGATTNTIENLPGGVYTVSGSDADGCTFAQTYLVVEEDTIAPILVTNPITIYLDATGNASFDPLDLEAGSSDNCSGIDTMYVDINTFGCDDLGDNTVQVVIFDANGNCGDAPETITVLDTIAPVIACPADITTMDCSGITYSAPTLSDNCSMNVLLELQSGFASGSVFPVGMTMVTYAGTDASGNTTSCSFNVEVINDLAANAEIVTYNCDGTATLNVNFSGGTPPYTSVWNPGNPGAPFVVTDSFSLEVTDANGCVANLDSVFSIPSPITMRIDSSRNEDQTMANGAAFSSLSGGTSPFIYEWTDGNGMIVGTQQNLENVPTGRYTLTVTDANGCASTDMVFIDRTTVSTNNLKLNQYVDIFPNPTNGDFQIELDLPSSENVSVQIFNLDGKIFEQTAPQNFRKTVLKFENKNWSSGMYLVKIIAGEDVLVKRLMIE